MELPSVDTQTTMYSLLGIIGAGLMAIARGLFKLLNHFLDKAKTEGEDRGKILAKLDNLDSDIKELKVDLDSIALFVETPRALARKHALEKQKENPSD